MWKLLNKEVDLGEPTSFSWSCIHWLTHSKTKWNKQRYCGQLQNHVRIANFSGRNRKTSIPSKSFLFLHGLLWYGRSCKEVCGTILWVVRQDDSTTLQSTYSLHRWPPLQRRRNEICSRIVTSMLSNCSKMLQTWHVLEDLIFYGYWTNLHDPSQNGPKLVTNAWINWFHHIHHTCEYIQYCYVGKTAKQCRLVLFQDSDFAGDLEDSKSTSGGTLCILGSHTFVTISWMCKKQTAVSHSSTETEIISLDAGLRLDGLLASGFMRSNCFCFWKSDSDLRQNGATCWYWKKSKTSMEDQRAEEYWLCSLKRPVFASRSFVFCVRRQWSSDQDDH